MKAIVQRVRRASVITENKTVAEIGSGLLILLGVALGDDGEKASALARKIAMLRIFSDSDGKMNLSVLDVGGSAVVVSNFTLCADSSHGHRPSFTPAAPPDSARPLYELFVKKLREFGIGNVQTGRFGADMLVSLDNDGPVTLILEI